MTDRSGGLPPSSGHDPAGDRPRRGRAAGGVPRGDAVLQRLRDAYLDVWSGYGSAPELREQADAALRVAPLPRTMTCCRSLRGVHPAGRTEGRDAVPGWVAEYLVPGILTPVAAAPA